MANVTIRLEDWRGEELRAAVDEAARAAEDETARVLVREIEASAPYRTGRLKETTFGTARGQLDDGQGAGAQVTARQKGKRAGFYWYFVNSGTRLQRPQPFADAAYEAGKAEFDRIATDHLQEAIKE